MRYYSAKGIVFVVITFFMLTMTIIALFNKVYIMTFVMCLVTAYFVWMWFDTYYVIEGDNLFYKSGFIKGTISINAITEIVKNKKMYSGVKVALVTKGLLVKYNKWDDIFISPNDADQFIKKLKEINNNIEVTG